MSGAGLCIAGIERLTLDYIVPAGPGTPAFQTPGEVRFASPSEAHGVFGVRPPGRPVLGGTVGSALCALARHGDDECRLTWSGFIGDEWLSRVAARLLRAEGIGVRPLGAIDRPTRALCVVDTAGGDVAGILVDVAAGPARVERAPAPGSVVLVGLDTLATATPRLVQVLEGRRLFLCVNHAASELTESGRALLAGGSWLGLSGRDDEVTVLERLADEHGIVLDTPRALTHGASGATITRGHERVELAPAAAEIGSGSTLGAGDAFAAGFALGLLRTDDLAAAGDTALAICGQWLSGAAPARRTRATARLRQLGAREYPGESGEVVAQVAAELSAGPSTLVCSGGQTGVDTIAAEEALGAGLASIMLLPLGGRREQPFKLGDRALAGSRVVELPTSSYGDRTAAVIDLCDLFVAVGDRATEGSVAATGMTQAMGRTLVALGDPADVAAVIADEPARVIGVGGPRGSRLSVAAAHDARVRLRALLRTLALGLPAGGGTASGADPRRIALPSTTPVAALCLDLVHAWCPGHPGIATDIGRWAKPKRCPRCDVVFALVRPRDMASLLALGCVDAALGGLDDLIEGGLEVGAELRQTRILESSVVVVAHAGATAAPEHYVSQLPAMAHALGFAAGELEAIHGCAETWLHLRGDAWAAVDTLHTGAKAARAGLEVIAAFGSTSLQIACRPGVHVPEQWLAAWPSYTRDLDLTAGGAEVR